MAILGANAATHIERALPTYNLPATNSPQRKLVCGVFKDSSRGSNRLILGPNRGGEPFYQPFRPPILADSPIPIEEQLQIIRERRGEWYEYGKHIPNLMRSGYTPATLDEETGLTGVEQNQIMVACQVRETLKSGGMDEETLAFFNGGGAAVLYELRILSAQERRVAARYVAEKAMDAKAARDVARALKDFDRRKREFGREFFTSSPGDSLAFWWYRQSKEFKDESERKEALQKALQYASSERSRSFVEAVLGREQGGVSSIILEEEQKKDIDPADSVRVVRLDLGETAGLVMLPVAEPVAESVERAPTGGALGEGGFRIHKSEVGWKSWVPLPGWQPVLDAVSPLTVLFSSAQDIGLRRKNKEEEQEEVLLVVDKGNVAEGELESDSVYLVCSDKGLCLQTGKNIKQKVLAKVILALAPPSESAMDVDEIDFDD